MTILESSLDTTLIAWSKNKIWFVVETDPDWKNHADYVLFYSVGKAGSAMPFVRVRLQPDPDGHALCEVQEFVDSQIKYFLPHANTPHAVAEPHEFWVKFSETMNGVTTHTQVDFTAIKAGTSEESEFLQNLWFAQKRFLTLVSNTKPTAQAVPEYLYYYQDSGSLDLKVKLFFDDDTSTDFTAYSVSFAGKTMICPVGFEALDLASHAAGKTPVAYEVQLGESEKILFQISDLYVEKRIFLYANTLGGFDTLICEGNWESKIQVDKNFYEAVEQNRKVRKVQSQKVRRTGKAATSWLQPNYLASVQDFLTSTEIYELLENEYVPISVEGSFVFDKKDEDLSGLAFEYEYLENRKLKRL